MFKKSLFMLIAFAMVATTVMIPMASSAAEISDSLYFNVDFKDGKYEDSTGNFTFDSDSSGDVGGDITFESDSELNRQVAVFTGWGALVYKNVAGENLNGYNLTQGITLEAYVRLNAVNDYNPVFVETAGSSLHLMQYNSGDDASVGFRCGDVPGAGEGGEGGDAGYMMRNAYQNSVLDNEKWVHLVGTSNGTVNQFYVDGQLVATEQRVGSSLKTVNGNTSDNIFIGESFFGGMFGPTALQGKVALVRVYKAYADEATADAMYQAAVKGEDVNTPTTSPTGDPTTSPTGDPTTSPTGDPTTSPSGSPSNSPSNSPAGSPTNKPTDSNNGGKTPNTQTFDLGLVSLAAVALSSAVAIKKRK